jgi:hypothetical protein
LSETPDKKPSRRQRLREALRNAFDLRGPNGPLAPEDIELLDRLARKVVDRRMTMPATLFLQSVRPLNAIGSQAMIFLKPFLAGLLFNEAQYNRLAAIMERREGITALIDAIETAQLAREGTAL